MKSSIRTKSAAFLALLLILTVSILSYSVLSGIKSNQKKKYEGLLSQQAKVANLYINQTYASMNSLKMDVFLKSISQDAAKQIGNLSNMHVVLYDSKGEEIGNSFSLGEKNDVQDTLAYTLKGSTAYQIMGETLSFFSPVYISTTQVGAVQFDYSLMEDIIFYKYIMRLFIVIGIITFFLSFIIGFSYFGRMAADILNLKITVERIKSGLYGETVNLNRKDELHELSQGIYFMSNQIQRNIRFMEEEQEKLKLAVDKLRILENLQKQFISNITHEFKTPLTIIKAYIDLMDMYTDDPKLIEDAKVKISSETQRLYEMLDKALNIASLEKYDFESQAEKIDVKEILEDICGRMEGKITKFGLKLKMQLDEAVIYADRENMIQILINLLDNAIKYNRLDGEIYVNNYIKDKNIYIKIMNTGPSIPQEARDKIFEPFYRVDKDRSRESGGAGLGLALVKRLVESQNGSIKLLDTYEEGTAFEIVFPIFI